MLLAVCAVLLGATLLLSRSRPMALTLAVFMAGLQIYFGVSLPAWVNLPLFGLLGAVCLADPRKPRMVLIYTGSITLIAAVVFLLTPGVHEATVARLRAGCATVSALSSLGRPRCRKNAYPDVLETRHENRVTLDFGAQEGQQLGLPPDDSQAAGYFPPRMGRLCTYYRTVPVDFTSVDGALSAVFVAEQPQEEGAVPPRRTLPRRIMPSPFAPYFAM